MVDLALLDQVLDRARDVFDGDLGVDPVLVEQVDDLDLEPFEEGPPPFAEGEEPYQDEFQLEESVLRPVSGRQTEPGAQTSARAPWFARPGVPL